MEKERTPAKTKQARTMFSFTQAETTEALVEWLVKNGHEVPDGKAYADQWAATLIVVEHPDPPPARKDVGDE